MTDEELLQATLLALTPQNMTGSGGGKPKDVTISFIEMIFDLRFWVGETIEDEFYRVN